MGARHALVLLLILLSFAPPALGFGDAPPALEQVSKEFEGAVLPLVKRYCLECHSAEEQEGDLDLERFTKLDQVRNAPRVWQRVAEMLDNGEMPPKEADQPDAGERARLRGWVRGFLTAEAIRRAGDPGRVVLRRLNNAEYTYTLRDLTGVATLEPAREFPVDGAAGEGFTNTGNALVMSPSLVTKYLDAAKGVAGHAVLLPDGFRFSPGATPRDWTEETLTKIRDFYREYTDPRSGGEQVNLQGIVFDTNQGGRLPLDRYFAATIAERSSLISGAKSIETVASESGLNAKYLGILWRSLSSSTPSLLLGGLQARWRVATLENVPALVAEVAAWQQGLWKFSSVGHIGKLGGPKAWMEPVSPLNAKQEVRFKVPSSPDGNDVTLSLVATDAGDGNEHDFVVWRQPRLVAPGRPDLPLRDVRRVASDLATRRERLFADTTEYLDASAKVEATRGRVDLEELALGRGLDPVALRAWLDYLGIVPAEALTLTGHFTDKLTRGGGHDFINGWGRNETPQLLTNSSDQHVRIPGNMKPHGVAVHPSPTLRTAVGWLSPVMTTVRVEATVRHAHPECGNGVTWSLELRRGSRRRRLAAGIAQGDQERKVDPIERLAIQPGDLLALAIGARDGNHSCDLTAIDLRIVETGETGRTWDLAADVSSDVLAGNPHADRLGHPGVWHFYTEPDKGGTEADAVIPAESVLARWQAAKSDDEKHRLAAETQRLIRSGTPASKAGPDATLYRQLRSLGGPLLGTILRTRPEVEPGLATIKPDWGLDESRFGKHPNGKAIDAGDLCVQAPTVISFRLPAELAEGAELVTTGTLEATTGAEGSVQFNVVAGPPPTVTGLNPSGLKVTLAAGPWTSDNRRASSTSPIVVNDGSASRKRIEAALDDFRNLFPAALCYNKIVPVDEVVTLTLFHREDGHLARLMLDDAAKAKLDRLWDELHFISGDALTLVDAFAQLMEYASQDADPKVFEPLRQPINDRADAYRRRLVAVEPTQVGTLLDFAARAYRRALTEAEASQLLGLYKGLRAQEIPHEEAFRMTLARVLVAPAFLYRAEKPVPGAGQGPVSNEELATRLSYFLWSSQPDRELRTLAESGKLTDPKTLASQARRMLRDDKARRLATEFACQWLHIADFDQLDEKSERHFPTFLGLRGAMYEESVRFFTDLFRNDGSILDILDADHTFLNGPLAEHYGIPLEKKPGVAGKSEDWRRVDGIKQFGRRGVLGQATVLAKQSGASRTSPTLRGDWISEVLLGERLPRPPKGIPLLPDDEAGADGLSVRQLVEQHASNPKCIVCHERIDPLGFSLEGFDAIGRRRDKDLGGRPIDARSKAKDGTQFEGLEGLTDYLLTVRRESFLNQACRKLLGFALGRSIQLSDATLLADMQAALKTNDYRVGSAIEVIVLSRQFREIRGRETADTD
ncbi:Planctomycete cytochrome C [Singulisphaera sp. GP187]|uniref:DUF1592 domain-containing protein n=1 Tax=Singulisphaera sp. GP187 TaxID=1882752 RepID=UPI00092C1814|nr:DUF1592 domain-containing protein [Singulisphaera sp. GP187]SIO61268.1 Planctomycete cytochrome C [Singulisphaera sp. GP187]